VFYFIYILEILGNGCVTLATHGPILGPSLTWLKPNSAPLESDLSTLSKRYHTMDTPKTCQISVRVEGLTRGPGVDHVYAGRW